MTQTQNGAVAARQVLNLAARRNSKGIPLEEVAEATKISIRSLKAIEACEFDKLPGGIYATNYIKQYARFVHIDESELLELYDSQAKVEPAVRAEARSPLMRLIDFSWTFLNL